MGRHGSGGFDDGANAPTPPQGIPHYRPGQYGRPDQTRPLPSAQYGPAQYGSPQYGSPQNGPPQHRSSNPPPYGQPDHASYDDGYTYGQYEQPRRAGRGRVLTIVAVSVALVLGLSAVGWALLGADSSPGPLSVGTNSTSDDPTDAVPTTDPVATPTPTPTPTPKPTTAKPKPKATAKKPPTVQLPPAPPPPKTNSPTCIKYVGTKATPTQVASALKSAGAIAYWTGVTPPSGATGPLPSITVPNDLMRAIAFTESSWVSNVISCDGGIGTMQVMSGTAAFVNQRFDTDYDVNTLSGNTKLGAAYLEWLTVYFGLYYFGSFDLNATAPIGPGGSDLKLVDAVVAAYNVGPTAVEDDHGTSDGADDTLSIPNQWYVDRVAGYRTNCPCDAL